MALVYTEEQQLLKDSVKGFLQQRAPISELRKLRDTQDGHGFCRTLWTDMSAMGWTGMVIPELFDGLDFGYTGVGILCEEMGRTLSASPILSTALVSASLINLAGSAQLKAELLPAIVASELVVTLAVDEAVRYNPKNIALTAEPGDDGYRLNGSKIFVVDGHVADKIIVAVRSSGQPGDCQGISLFIVDADTEGLDITRTLMVDSRNAATLNFDDVYVSSDALLGNLDDAFPVLEKVLDIGAICIAAEMLGIMQESFERTLQYLRERKQFGQLIGSFQALQHRAAHLFCEIELCKSVVLKALYAIDEGSDQLPILASLAKAKTSETVQSVVNEAIQMHGGIGMTDDFEIGFFIKRASVTRQLFGDAYYHANRFAELSGY